MKILAIGRDMPNMQPEDFQPHLKDEAARAWQLYQSGVLREIYFRQDQPDAVLMLECKDVTEAQEILNTLPLVQKGLIAFDLMTLSPYPGFSRLFADDE